MEIDMERILYKQVRDRCLGGIKLQSRHIIAGLPQLLPRTLGNAVVHMKPSRVKQESW